MASDLFRNDVKLKAKNDTKWNRVNKMPKSILKADPANMESLDFSGKLSKYEIKFPEEVTEILNLFEIATDQYQGQNVVTASLVLPCIREIRAELNTLFHIQIKNCYDLNIIGEYSFCAIRTK